MTSTTCREEVVDIMKELFPLDLAETWDNVGVLVQPPAGGPMSRASSDVVLFTNDLTEHVINEAINSGAGMIVTYHPRPFSGLKKLCEDDTTAFITMRCIQHDIWVYSPHTACDNADGGVNDWLAECVSHGKNPKVRAADESANRGRHVELSEPVPLEQIISHLKAKASIRHVRFSPANNLTLGLERGATEEDCTKIIQSHKVSTIAVQAGSGSCVLEGVKADVWVTGEMSHHDVLSATAKGTSVILTEHSNSERAFLHEVAAKVQNASTCQAKCTVSVMDCDPLRIQ
eukprot:CAMPEP_0184549496 /NCGR_PEP_ID=MMETSP0199_2-20130426/10821_1 /TAXON_ID=1112570 /ORGANISM="Thraustochytrium sp., Strain LLF1b" /LENGTH=287 /DNA_ID=CAMNT_0026944225 /DNA_START=35 /DNA_END=898 /DNA_ORIENTATION=-